MRSLEALDRSMVVMFPNGADMQFSNIETALLMLLNEISVGKLSNDA